MEDKALGLAVISAATVALGHEWLHSSDITQDLPELGIIGGASSTVGSVSVGLIILTLAGVAINYYVYEME